MNKSTIGVVIATIALIVSVTSAFQVISLADSLAEKRPESIGAAGNLKIEDYDPYVRYNGGINTDLDMTIGGGELTVTTAANATSTLLVGRIETYASSSATKICVRPSTTGATSTFSGALFFTYGSC